jgi:magnesium transporter
VIHTRVRTSDGVCLADVPLDELHPLVDDPRALLWLDLEAPSPDEVGLVGALLTWEHLTVEDLIKQGQRAKLEAFDRYVYLVMHALGYAGDPARLTTPEVDFVIGANYVVSLHPVPLPALIESREVTQHTEALLRNGPDYLLYVLADRLVDSYFPALDALDDAVDELQDRIVTDPSSELMGRIFEMKRDAVTLRKVISPQLETFNRLTSPDFGVVTAPHVIYFRDVHDHLIRVFEVVDGYRDLLSGALDAYLTTVSNRMNEVMKRLTVLAALFLPITFITGVFGMNLRVQPLWKDPIFWVFLLGMAGLSVVQWLYFRRKGWV